MSPKTSSLHEQIEKELQQYAGIHGEEWSLTGWKEVCCRVLECKQRVTVDTELKPDTFSIILLKLIQSGITNHAEITAFLGIAEHNILESHFRFLIREGIIQEKDAPYGYTITQAGKAFLDQQDVPRHLQQMEIQFHYLPLSKQVWDPRQPLGTASSGKKSKFPGYQLNEDDGNVSRECIPEKSPKMNIADISQADILAQIHAKDPQASLYDIETSGFKARKKLLPLLLLEYEHPTEGKRYDIRRYFRTIRDQDWSYDLEETLTEAYRKNQG